LRTPRLHEALNGLRKAGALQNEEVQMLIDAYRFFRHLINGLRMLRGNALDLFLPDKGAVEFAHLARRMGYASGAISAADALYVDIQQYSAEVRSIIEKHLGRGAIPGSFTGNVLDVLLRKEGAAAEAQEFFARHGFREPQKAWAGMKYLHEVCEPCFRRIVVLAFEVLKDQPDHDLALLHWTQLVERVDARAHYRTLAKQPKRMEILFGLFGVSRFLSDILLQHPEFFDWVTEPATVANVRALDDLLQDVRGMIAQGNEHGISPRNVLRVFRKREMVRIGTRDLQIAVPLKYTLEEISSLAQAVVMTALEEVWKQQAEKAGDSAGAGRATPEKFCILAFGKFGGEELNYSSDIDLLAIYEPAGEQRDQNEIKQYTSVVRGLVAELNEYTSEGYAYRVDLRLRPFGASGDVAWSVPRIVEYYRKDASLWEFQALIKLRPIAGNLDLGADFLRQVRQIMAGTCSDKAVIDSIRQLREEAVQQYRSKELRLQPSQASPVNSLPEKLKEALAELPATDIKNGIGGIRDIEFLVQGLQMMHCGSATEVLHGGTLEALRRLAKKQALDQTDAVELAEYYVFLRRIEHLLQIFEDRQVHGLPLDERSLSRLARKALGPKSDAAELVRHIATQMRNVRRLYETFLQKCS
ncbi:MAG: hypothetical protein D6B26_05620, partial [Spirochaetaceae bacterium]